MSAVNVGENAGPPSTARSGGLLVRIVNRINTIARPFAGRRWLPLWSILLVPGRRSGRLYATPVAARRIPGGFIVPLAFGPEAQWFRNLMAAGGCSLRWKGIDYELREPEAIDWSEAQVAFSGIQRFIVERIGLAAFVRLHEVAAP